MKHPAVGTGAGLQRQQQIVGPVHPRGAKRVDVLMVVVDRGDAHA